MAWCKVKAEGQLYLLRLVVIITAAAQQAKLGVSLDSF
jgi:hypothetical protein